tara:strand:- start:707 stop:817 length:111 start_codon:yes stop_codon:yes gene_type:complete
MDYPEPKPVEKIFKIERCERPKMAKPMKPIDRVPSR